MPESGSLVVAEKSWRMGLASHGSISYGLFTALIRHYAKVKLPFLAGVRAQIVYRIHMQGDDVAYRVQGRRSGRDRHGIPPRISRRLPADQKRHRAGLPRR